MMIFYDFVMRVYFQTKIILVLVFKALHSLAPSYLSDSSVWTSTSSRILWCKYINCSRVQEKLHGVVGTVCQRIWELVKGLMSFICKNETGFFSLAFDQNILSLLFMCQIHLVFYVFAVIYFWFNFSYIIKHFSCALIP